ncbi:DUF1007 family protein [Novispirillum sp. DQ9]|uniref:DUF1007 family protein n=1 Tax=Novispirillum sp. DQ9 TaxID=3398612 RepID=UPI003C7CA9C0
MALPRRLAPWLGGAAAALAAVLVPQAAWAHPHVWIEAALRLDVAPDGALRAVAVTWTFDELYSQVSVEGLDSDGDGIPSPADLAPMIDEAMGALEEWGYFLSLRRDGVRLPTARAGDGRASFANGRLTYAFTVPLAQPAALSGAAVEIRAFDPAFYIDIAVPDATAVSLEGAPERCAVTVTDPPPMEEVMLIGEAAALDADVAPGSDGLGGRFAQTVRVACD